MDAFMAEERAAEEAALKLRETIRSRKDGLRTKKEEEEQKKMDAFMEEERRAIEAADRLKLVISNRREEMNKKKRINGSRKIRKIPC